MKDVHGSLEVLYLQLDRGSITAIAEALSTKRIGSTDIAGFAVPLHCTGLIRARETPFRYLSVIQPFSDLIESIVEVAFDNASPSEHTFVNTY
jgi:hypothetical protein